MDMPRALTAALQQLEAQHNPRRELVLFSDMQAAGWGLGDRARWSFIANAVQASRVRPNIILASTSDARLNNLALLRIEPSRQVVDCYSPVTYNVIAANEGPEAIKDATVAFIVDHAPKATRSLSLAPGAREVLAFDHKFERPGSHFVTCRLRAAQDDTVDDDERHEHPQAARQERRVRLHKELCDGDECRDDHDVARDADFFGHYVAHNRDEYIGTDKYKSRGHAHADTVNHGRRNGKRRAESEYDPECRIFPP
jgi:hypothetical protein